jgi:hypothetical protein
MARTQSVPFALSTLSDDALVDARAVARVLGISTRQVSRLADLPVVTVSDRVRRYPVGGLRQWIASRTRGKAAA